MKNSEKGICINSFRASGNMECGNEKAGVRMRIQSGMSGNMYITKGV